MKKKHLKNKLGIFKYLLILPLFLLAFCQSEFEEPFGDAENKLTKDSKLLSLMKAAIQSDSDQISTQNKGDLSKGTTGDDGQCTYFLYPMNFQVYSGDDPVPVTREINSDEELLAFIEEFSYENQAGVHTENYEMFIYFPIILLDTDGNETVLNSLIELEGTLDMAVQACESFNNASDGDSGGDSGDASGEESDGSSDNGSGDASGGESESSSGESSEDNSDDGSNDASGEEADGGSDDESQNVSGDVSGDSSDGGSDDESNDGSDGSSDDESEENSSESSEDDPEEGSDDDSNNGSDDSTDDDSEEDSIVESSQGDDDDNGYKFCDKNSKKVYICHKGKTICVSVNAIWGHLQHHEEDFLGTCDDE